MGQVYYWYGCGVTLMVAGSAMAETFMPLRAQALRESVGVNTHIHYTDGAYARVSDVIRALDYLDIRQVRDIAPQIGYGGGLPLAGYIWMNKAHVRFNLLIAGGVFDADRALAGIEKLEAERPGAVQSIEGFNEVNNWPVTYNGVASIADSVEAHKALVSRLQASPALAHIPVLDLTGADDPVDLKGRGDYHNVHAYAQNGNQPGIWIDRPEALKRQPWAITEFGYASNPQSGWLVIGVGEEGQAKGLLNGILDAAQNGAWRIYLYELLDEKPDPQTTNMEMHFGLFTYENKPKLSAKSLRNFLRLFRDRDAAALSFTPQPLDITLTGAPETMRTLALQKASGLTQFALWNEIPFWDRATGTAIKNPPVPVTLTLAAGAKALALYDPLQQEKPIHTYAGESEVTVLVPDYPVIVEIQR